MTETILRPCSGLDVYAGEGTWVMVFRTANGQLKMAGFIDVARLNFVGVFPYTCWAGAPHPHPL